MTHTKHLAAVGALIALAAPATASALPAPLKNDAAMRKGIRDYARVEAHGAKASRMRITCGTATEVGKTVSCRGSFRLTLHGRHADYRLTKKAGTFRNTAHSVEYHVAARAAKKVKGLPSRTGTFAGFLQSSGGS